MPVGYMHVKTDKIKDIISATGTNHIFKLIVLLLPEGVWFWENLGEWGYLVGLLLLVELDGMSK